MNGLQSMDTWQEYFQHPAGGTLGMLNAVQVLSATLFSSLLRLTFPHRISAACLHILSRHTSLMASAADTPSL
jgi:hypothetical protein